MTFIVHVNTGTKKTEALFNHLSADPNRLTKEWPEIFGLTEAINAGIDSDDYAWFIDDLERANIQRLGEGQFRIALDDTMQETTPDVFAALSSIDNRLGNTHFRLVCEVEGKRFTPLTTANNNGIIERHLVAS